MVSENIIHTKMLLDFTGTPKWTGRTGSSEGMQIDQALAHLTFLPNHRVIGPGLIKKMLCIATAVKYRCVRAYEIVSEGIQYIVAFVCLYEPVCVCKIPLPLCVELSVSTHESANGLGVRGSCLCACV
uniref:Uncharacterized protein n=1 Tax=Anguilla anguilla TaxID=7936 RepID=A0A0E9WIE1_ANGAN